LAARGAEGPAATLANGGVGAPYSQTLTASGGSGSYSFTVLSGSLPGGLTLSTGGVLSGLPNAAGTYMFTVLVEDMTVAGLTSSQSYSVTIDSAISIMTGSLPNGGAGAVYNQAITASGGSGSYSFAITSGSLPDGLRLSAGGVLTGTSTTAGTFNFRVTVRDKMVAGLTSSQSYSVTIDSAIIIMAATLANGGVGAPYSQTLTASGGSGSYSFTMMSGSLPSGLRLSTGGVLSGTPTAAGTFTVTVMVADTMVAGLTSSQSFRVTINPALSLTITTLPNGGVDAPHSQTTTSTQGSNAVRGSVPSGSSSGSAAGGSESPVLASGSVTSSTVPSSSVPSGSSSGSAAGGSELSVLASVPAASSAVPSSAASNSGTNKKAARVEAALTYQALNSNIVDTGSHFWLQGGSLQVHTRFLGGFGTAIDLFGVQSSNVKSTGASLDIISVVAGPRYTWQLPYKSRASLFGEALLGEAFANSSSFPGAGTSDRGLALTVGGGLDYAVHPQFSLRALEVNWLRTQLPNAASDVQNNLRIGAGVIYRSK
jgi:hypothetical protein